jgi:TonB family protein
MSDGKPCVRCSRQIDAYARTCLYCNWDQSEVPPPPEPTAAAEVPIPHQNPWRNKALAAAAAFVALLVMAVVVGSFVHGFEASEVKAGQSKSTTAAAQSDTSPTPPKNVTLVAVTGADGTAPVAEPPITSAPASTTAQEPNDTTALPSDQYATAAARAKARQQKELQRSNDAIDPRAFTGAPYEQPSNPEPAQQTANAREPRREPARTFAFPEYKPLPRLSLDHDMTARLTVTVAPDGRVTDIEVNQPVPKMLQVIAAVQNWRFRPATENGMPVTARVAVDIIFHGNG